MAERTASPSQLVKTLEDTQRTRWPEYLREDYFDITWASLDRKTRESLISAEHTWHTAPSTGGRRLAALDDYRIAFEVELRALVVQPIVNEMQLLLYDENVKAVVGSGSWSPEGLTLGQLARVLRALRDKPDIVQPICDLVAKYTLSSEEKRWLCEAVADLAGDLWSARTNAVHPLRGSVEQAKLLRRRLLGINCVGILPRLVKLRARAQASARPTP